jgi:hypothetical protein
MHALILSIFRTSNDIRYDDEESQLQFRPMCSSFQCQSRVDGFVSIIWSPANMTLTENVLSDPHEVRG